MSWATYHKKLVIKLLSILHKFTVPVWIKLATVSQSGLLSFQSYRY